MRTERAPELLLDTPQEMSLYLSQEQIGEIVRRLAAEISRDYAGKRPLLLCVLKSAFIFLADLIREINIPLTVDFIRAQSYKGTTTMGEIGLSMGDVVDVGAETCWWWRTLSTPAPPLAVCLIIKGSGNPRLREFAPCWISLSDERPRWTSTTLGSSCQTGSWWATVLTWARAWRNLPYIFCLEDDPADEGGQDG